MIQTYLIEPSGKAARSLRRYSRGSSNCPITGYHDAATPDGDVSCHLERRTDDDRYSTWIYDDRKRNPPRDDPAWPKACACGYAFTSEDPFQVFHDVLYRRVDGTNDRVSLRDNPVGAMYYSEWCACHHEPKCDRHLFVICPGGSTWDIDSRCSNCTLREDRIHHCWVRTGELPNITVSKGGVTCAAGAGSIAVPGYHGFLQDGHFT